MNTSEVISNSTYLFMDALSLAEQLFGERDKSWTYIGLEFRDSNPHIRYYGDKKISIVLSNECIRSPIQFAFQLSHEVCHLLYPTGKRTTNNLEEGVSAYFS